MTDYEKAFAAVRKATGIGKKKIISKGHTWPVQEARMIFIMLLSGDEQSDQYIAWILNRSRQTVSKTRLYAAEYICCSRSFYQKFTKAHEVYASE